MAITVTDNSFIRVDTPEDMLFAIAVYTAGGFPFWYPHVNLPSEKQLKNKDKFPGGAFICVQAEGTYCELHDRNTVAARAYRGDIWPVEIELPSMWQILNEPDLSSFFD